MNAFDGMISLNSAAAAAGAFKAVNGETARPADPRVGDAFPKLSGVPHVVLQATGGPLAAAPGADKSLNIAVVLSGGQAPGVLHAAKIAIFACIIPLSVQLQPRLSSPVPLH